MINNLHIERFKDVVEETLELKPLTVITGVNSAGKSAAIQAILAVLKKMDAVGGLLLKPFDYSFKGAVCKYGVFEDYHIILGTDSGNIGLLVNAEEAKLEMKEQSIGLEKNVYYLSANRNGYDKVEQMADDYPVGVQGEYLFGTLYNEKDAPIALKLFADEEQCTLGSMVDYWLREILGMEFKVHTEEKNSNIIVSYDADEVKGLMPNQLDREMC